MRPIVLRIICIIIALLGMYLWAYLSVNYEFRDTWWVFPTEFVCVMTMISLALVATSAPDTALEELIDAFKKK